MDEIDRKLIAYLRNDSRVSFTELADKLKMTEGAIRYRVKALVKLGVIRRFTIEVMREEIPMLIGVKAKSSVNMQNICSRIIAMEGVERIFEITGDLDAMVLARTKNPKDLNNLIESIRVVPGVSSTISYMVLQEHGA